MVRGTSVDGFNLVPDWLAEGDVSLSASQLGAVDPDASISVAVSAGSTRRRRLMPTGCPCLFPPFCRARLMWST